MTRTLGDYVSAVHGAAVPIAAAATQAAPKLFVAGLRGLQAMGLPFYGAAALLACGCALLAFLTIWLAFRAIANVFSALGHGIARGAGAARSGLSSFTFPALSLPKLSRPSGRGAAAGHAAAPPPGNKPDEAFVPVWDPFAGVRTGGGIAPAADPERTASIGSMPSRPTPASVEAAAFTGSPRIAEIADPLAQEEVPPGFLFIDTSLSSAAAASQAAHIAQPAPEAHQGERPSEPAPPAPGTSLAAPIPFPARPGASQMTIDEALRFASELREGHDRSAPERANGRTGRSAVAS